MEQEFEDYWKKCRQLLIKNAPTALYEERKNNTKMNTAGDWLLFILPIVVMVGFYDAHVIANVIIRYFDNLLYFMLSHSPRQILIYLSMSLNIMVFFRHFSTARFHTQSPQFPLACITLNSLS